ncbi:MAG: hypothetical protein ACRC9R_00300 [Enterovibrio sp.]
MNKILKWTAISVVMAILTGCARTVPIADVQSSFGVGHTATQVKNAILQAGIKRKWVMTEVGDGVIDARQKRRDRIVEVKIIYSDTDYKIQYSNSTNMFASDGTIHKNYKRWVRNLDKQIWLNLARKVGQ